MRRYIIAGNWKMNAPDLARFGAELCHAKNNNVTAVICPPFPFLSLAAHELKDVKIGAQDVSAHESGAYTGEVSAKQLWDAGADYVIIGHSERRAYHGESDELVNKKVSAALSEKLTPIICVGETQEQRNAGAAQSVVEKQVEAAFTGLDTENAARCIVAYEPVWAIGTGLSATPEDAQSACGAIKNTLRAICGESFDLPVLYGGSMNTKNAEELLWQPDIDGGLIGGASLEAVSFSQLCEIAARISEEK